MQTYLLQEAFRLKVTPGQVHMGISFMTDRSGNLKIYQVLEAFNNLKQTNDSVDVVRGQL